MSSAFIKAFFAAHRIHATLALGAAILFPLGGCSLLSSESWNDSQIAESSSDDVILRLSLEKPVYRPGEAVVIQVTMINTTDEPIRLRNLDKDSLSFWYGPQGEDRRVQREPVVSALEEKGLQGRGGGGMELAPGQSVTRPFVHTRMTKEAGPFVAQVHMDAYPDVRSKRIGKIFSNPAEFMVHGDPLFLRDSMGLLDLEEGIKLAAASVPGDPFQSDALLIQDEMGFYKWWINLDYRDPQGEVVKTGYLIDPYFGRVWAEAKPFDASMKPREEQGARPLSPPPRAPRGAQRGR